VKLYRRPGNDLTDRFPLIVEALAQLHSRSCIIDGEAVACNDTGIAPFNRHRLSQLRRKERRKRKNRTKPYEDEPL
jgi:ATP-dependent DNA ligase